MIPEPAPATIRNIIIALGIFLICFGALGLILCNKG